MTATSPKTRAVSFVLFATLFTVGCALVDDGEEDRDEPSASTEQGVSRDGAGCYSAEVTYDRQVTRDRACQQAYDYALDYCEQSERRPCERVRCTEPPGPSIFVTARVCRARDRGR